MTERKPWTQEQDQLLLQLTQDARFGTGQKLRWGDIAIQLSAIGSKRTGKQCRQRWHNQLKPGIDNDRQWTPQQQRILFREQEQHGNRWALIAKALPGRTDNNIKNYFYSTLRKALRKINSYVSAHKKEQRYRNVKEFKPQTLSKILAVAESKYQQKINLKSSRVINDAKKLKKLLIQIQLDQNIDPSQEKCQILEEAVDEVLQFNRNCKRRKGKKKDEDNLNYQESSQEISSQVESIDGNKPAISKKVQNTKPAAVKEQVKSHKVKNSQAPKQIQKQHVAKKEQKQECQEEYINQMMVPINQNKSIEIKRSRSILQSGKMSDRAIVVRSQSSGISAPSFFDNSSSFNRLPTGQLMLNDFSHQYSKIQNQHFTRGLLDSMPIFEARRSDDTAGPFKDNPSNIHSIRMVDQSRGIELFQENPFKISTFLGNIDMRRKITSRLSRNQDLDELQ